ncbi:uncharacterized protein C8Q71DRAFT_707077 [Rhodofomes roseus]|uniref:DH domain-containing protein n=1 Tax=Rhodofomes roseus TaxID=34475 RepID=A0ABQ8KHY0_9APHY|nr:uncharacterized protein C8Q71DRAFT_707077 [Rhodofomes roseus]KAH9837271.1 hypothetical protein C8Q71DRAFT_707077 [Rhodofomes roseus]
MNLRAADKQLPAAPEDDEPSAFSSHEGDTTPRQSRYDDLADALTRDPPRLSSPTPPPVPPKSDRGHASKIRGVSIVEPSELSHDSTHEDSYYALDYTVSDPGHGSIPPASTSVPSPGRVPRRKTYSSRPARYSAGPYHSYPSRLSWADRASLPIFRQSFASDGHQMVSSPTSMSAFSESLPHPSHLARRKLRKPRPVSTLSSPPCSPPASSPSSGSSLNLLRALSHKSALAPRDSAEPSTASSPRNSINFFRIPRCTTQPSRRSASFLESDPMAMRRWTLAMADVPDEILVQELDKLRKNAVAKKARGKSRTPAQSESGHTAESGCSTGSTSPWRSGVHFRLGGDSDSEEEGDGDEEDEALDGFENDADEEEWKAARRALLCCRELVRTERSYQARLRELLNAQSSHPFFSLLLSYVPALLQASEALLVRLVDDPSAWGVGAAFIGCEEELEAALVAWCGVVGNFYIDDEKDKRGRKRRKSGDETTNALGHGEPRTLSPRGASQSGIAGMIKPRVANRRMSLIDPSENGMFTAALGTGLAFGLSSPPALESRKHGSTASFGKDHGPTGTLTRTLSAWKRKSMPSSLSNLQTTMGMPPSPSTAHGHSKEKLWTLRDLAIQPTQRVMRYVLQYKDLLAHTPVTSPSRGLVERALESAIRIAKKCDRAQGNSAFLR